MSVLPQGSQLCLIYLERSSGDQSNGQYMTSQGIPVYFTWLPVYLGLVTVNKLCNWFPTSQLLESLALFLSFKFDFERETWEKILLLQFFLLVFL